MARRCRALLLAAEGLSNIEIGMKPDMHRNAISNIRSRFKQIGLDSAQEIPEEAECSCMRIARRSLK
jgi:DNA-binding CsgD family transcriptional regulator